MKAEEFWSMTHDERVELYQKDPESYTKTARALVHDEISKISDEDKRIMFERSQWVLDGELRIIKNELVRAQVVYNKMLDSLFELNELMQKHNI